MTECDRFHGLKSRPEILGTLRSILERVERQYPRQPGQRTVRQTNEKNRLRQTGRHDKMNMLLLLYVRFMSYSAIDTAVSILFYEIELSIAHKLS